MVKTIPNVKSLKDLGYVIPCDSLEFILKMDDKPDELIRTVKSTIEFRSNSLPVHTFVGHGETNATNVLVRFTIDPVHLSSVVSKHQQHVRDAGYVLVLSNDRCEIQCETLDGFNNAFSTLKQLVIHGDAPTLHAVEIFDYPLVQIRSMSTTFAWYAGYGRIGFDSQLWGFEQWKEFLHTCADYKINQLNMCMYGYWPFPFPQYPETEFRDIEVPVWNKESENWIKIKYSHPNLVHEFFTELVEYAHVLSIRIFIYMGLNSYNGGYSNIHVDKRMKLPENSKFVNDFDSLCVSDPENVNYLKAAVKRVVQLGVDGIVFEESEEAFWFCECERCNRFHEMADSPANAKHEANYELLTVLHREIKNENSSCEVGLRAWREPPLSKEIAYLEHCRDSIPDDVSLYWAPGLYVDEDEFTKWVNVFGPERVCARDSESNAWSSTQGRLIRIFKSNVLRCTDETNDQFIEKDIEQHQGSVKHGVRGINGYLFEWYGYFLHLLAHAHYGWGADESPEAFYRSAIEMLFPHDLHDEVEFVLKSIMTIHESQINIFPVEFPFLRNKVEETDRAAIEDAISMWPDLDKKIEKIIRTMNETVGGNEMVRHFRKIQNAHKRNLAIYRLGLASLEYAKVSETDPKKARDYLEEMRAWNEADFDFVKDMFFDIYPVSKTGIRACMYPYHELNRVIMNKLDSEYKDNDMIYLGVEALGWLWI